VRNFVATLRSRSVRREMDALARYYAPPVPDTERERIQLERLNAVWCEQRAHVPHYAALARELAWPERWESLAEFAERVPATGRETLQKHRERLTSTLRPPELWGATGGSTAQPVQIPRWKSEDAETRATAWVGRSWHGVAPDDRLFLLWGHSHLLGTGWRGWLNARRRELDDRLLGYCRFSAYDLRDEAMRAAVRRILEFRPAYLVGYSVALDRLERQASTQRARLHELGIKVVIATSEAFPYPDSAARLADTFGCPVAMEYGAVEALGIAYEHPQGGYRLFWHNYLAEAERRDGRFVLRLTSLYPRSMPLVRYEIGDELELAPGSPDHVVGVTRFERVLGRCNDYVSLRDGTLVHSEAFSHAVRTCAAIGSYQVVQQGVDLRLRFTGARDPSDEEAAELRRRLSVIHADLGAIALERVEVLSRTIAGKTPMIIRREAQRSARQDSS
jgi:phenylacetate-coenzyme A ligase PaaK-like adenylate-forming protein